MGFRACRSILTPLRSYTANPRTQVEDQPSSPQARLNVNLNSFVDPRDSQPMEGAGVSVGAFVGIIVGTRLGICVGVKDGSIVGVKDGFIVGVKDGFIVGDAVGSILGAQDFPI